MVLLFYFIAGDNAVGISLTFQVPFSPILLKRNDPITGAVSLALRNTVGVTKSDLNSNLERFNLTINIFFSGQILLQFWTHPSGRWTNPSGILHRTRQSVFWANEILLMLVAAYGLRFNVQLCIYSFNHSFIIHVYYSFIIYHVCMTIQASIAAVLRPSCIYLIGYVLVIWQCKFLLKNRCLQLKVRMWGEI